VGVLGRDCVEGKIKQREPEIRKDFRSSLCFYFDLVNEENSGIASWKDRNF